MAPARFRTLYAAGANVCVCWQSSVALLHKSGTEPDAVLAGFVYMQGMFGRNYMHDICTQERTLHSASAGLVVELLLDEAALFSVPLSACSIHR